MKIKPIAKMLGFIILICLLPSSGLAGTLSVDGQATGRYYSEVLKRWMDMPIVLYVDSQENSYIKAGEQLITARGMLYPNETAQVLLLLENSLEWSNTAKREGVDIQKKLGSFLKYKTYSKHGVELTFFSSNKGNQTDVVLSVIDFENQFNTIELYLNPERQSSLYP